MTIPERVYRLILRAYPADYRREYGEPMLQLLRTNCGNATLRSGAWFDCGAGFWPMSCAVFRRHIWRHLRVQKEASCGIERRWLFFPRCSSSTSAIAFWRTRFSGFKGLSPAFSWRTGPPITTTGGCYTLAVWSVIDALKVVLAVALCLLIMKKFHIGRLARGIAVGVPIVVAGRIVFGLLSKVLWLLPVLAHALVQLLILGLAVALLLLIMKKLSIPGFARGVLVAVPIVAAGITGALLDELRPSMVAGYLVVSLLLPMSVVVGAWAANAWGRWKDESGPDKLSFRSPDEKPGGARSKRGNRKGLRLRYFRINRLQTKTETPFRFCRRSCARSAASKCTRSPPWQARWSRSG